CNAHGGFASGGTSAAAIIAQAVFLFVGVIGMAWTENVFNCAVILRTLVSVFDQQTNAGAGSNAFKNTGENFDLIRLTTLGGIARCPRATTVEIVLQVRFRQRNTRRNTIDDAAERQPVRFAEGGYAKELSNCVSSHHGSVIRS